MYKKAYAQSVQEVARQLATNLETGLSSDQVEQLRVQFGPNILPEKAPESTLIVFLRQFMSPLIYLLLIAAAIIFFLGEHLDAFVISGVLFFNAIIGTIQEGRARSIVQSLKRYITSDAIVVRDGQKHIIPSTALIPGDIIILEKGEKVPADARLFEVNNLSVDESMLTGETAGVYKSIESLEREEPLHNQANMLFRGTNVLSGHGMAIVTATGSHTAVGQLGKTVEEIKTDMPLKRQLDQLSNYILLATFGICVLLFAFGIYEGKPFSQLLVILTALFICVIPEGLPVVFTLALVTGASRLAKKQVLVKRLQAVEGLAHADVIVVDKTGTLTRNEMFVSRVITADQEVRVTGTGYKIEGELFVNEKKIELTQYPQLELMAHGAALVNRAEIEYLPDLDTFAIKGDPTEAALDVFAQKCGARQQELKKDYRSLFELPFDSAVRYQAGAYERDNKIFVFVIGAPEVIAQNSESVSTYAKKQLDTMLKAGLRILGMGMQEFAKAELPSDEKKRETFLKASIERNLNFLGFFGIEDTLRTDVQESIEQARSAGIRVVMATGDHKDTALFIARRTGIFRSGDLTLDGVQLEQMSDEELQRQLFRITVFSRVSPEDKLRIIHAYHQQNNIVAMTGDGVNDAPSLAAADLGIAMGAIGTEVAKEAADMILLNDSFASIVDGIREGRHVFYALRRAIIYFFTTNVGEVMVIMLAILLNLPLPLLAPQILWLNLITDGFLDVALTMEPQEKRVLNASFVTSTEHLVDTRVFLRMLFLATPMAVASLAMFMYYLPADLVYARTMALVTLAMFQWFNAWNCRSTTLSIFQSGFFSNPWLLLATIFVFILQLLLLYVPFLQTIFRTKPLAFNDWIIIIALSSSIILLEEGRKWFMRRRRLRAQT